MAILAGIMKILAGIKCKKGVLIWNVIHGVYDINIQTGPSLGGMHLHVIELTLIPATNIASSENKFYCITAL
uniref:Uncharacterized protein n=1 Tax=Rhizophagus irregularis (strain DAOM 181602 / DAOM 197198 / MUCL 43194) TaxID=747089 RepID=U9TGC8_RHIID